MNFLQQSFYKKFSIPLILFVFSFAIFSYNLEGQGIGIDEWFHYGFAMNFYDLVKEGNFLDECMTGNGDCKTVDLKCPGPIHRVGSGGLVKGIVVGLGDELFSENERVHYLSPDLPCRPIHLGIEERGVNIPTQEELAAARFFVPIFSALTIVIAFQIGKLLFNKSIGITFAVILLFHSLWFYFSRTVLFEVFLGFFILLTILLTLYSFDHNKIKYKYLILASVIFALAVNTKPTALEIFPFIIGIILLRDFWNNKIVFSDLKRKFSKKTIFLVFIFISIFIISLFATFPYYWLDPLGQTLLQIESVKSENYGGLTLDLNKKIILPMIESATIAPIIDSYYYIFFPDEIPQSVTYGHTFSSLPLSLFFFVGLFWIFYRIRRKQITYAEFLIFIWYACVYSILTPLTESYNTSRHFIPIIFPMILIMAYGLNNFLTHTFSKKIKTSFWIFVVATHSITYLVFWDIIYFKPEIILNLPLLLNLRESFSHPIVLISGVIFIIVFLLLTYYRIRKIS